MTYKYTRLSADALANGCPLGYGDLVDLTRRDQSEPQNARLIESGALIEAPPTTTQEKS